ncbi:MAG: FtsW/RodA/SpoVE family cell cycle protein [Lachnospiraceae bacterium]|nr:FtsW/RodA/SpoVE family cell cycle protein [Lachnospiraceae bacterium]
MINLISLLAQYLSVILLAVYGWLAFSVYLTSDEKKKGRKLTAQIVLVFLIHFLWNLILFMRMESLKVLLLYGAEILIACIYMALYHRYYPYSSRAITNNMCFLLLLGYTMLTRINTSLAIRQFVISAVSMLIVSFIPLIMLKYHNLRKYYLVYGIMGILALLTVFIPKSVPFFHGLEVYGSRNWIQIGTDSLSISLQPSEFVKILFVFFVASIFAKSTSFRQVVLATCFAVAHIGVLVLEKDLGGALIYFVVYVMMLYVATQRSVYLLLSFGAVIAAGGFAFLLFRNSLFQHVIVRVNNWIDPWTNIDSSGYQIAQSLFAIGSGGWFGSGIGQGMPELIPVRESDFIFSVISEEMGLIAAMILILICFSVFIGFIDVSMKSKMTFYKNMALGFAICYIFQILLNIGGVTKFIPSTGVTLPLVSYGLSSVTSTLIVFQIIQGTHMISLREAQYIEREKEKILSAAESGGIPAPGEAEE